MSRAKELLDAATPLPWSVWDAARPGIEGSDSPNAESVVVYGEHGEMEGVNSPENAALIVYAVNRLPDYEAALEALERIGQKMAGWKDATQRAGVYREADPDQQMAKWVHDEAIAALRRLGGAE